MATEKIMKKLKALVVINLDNKLRTPGTKTEVFEASEEDAAPLIAVGAAEEVAEEKPASKAK